MRLRYRTICLLFRKTRGSLDEDGGDAIRILLLPINQPERYPGCLYNIRFNCSLLFYNFSCLTQGKTVGGEFFLAQHFLTCPQRVPWTTPQLTCLDEKLETLSAAPNLRWMLMRQLRHPLLDHGLGSLHLDAQDSALFQSQEAIGWPHILQGRFSSRWEAIQLVHDPCSQGWQAKVIWAIWLMLRDLWHVRNTHLHDQSPVALNPVQQRLLEMNITNLYDLQPALNPADQHLFPDTLENILQQITAILNGWLRMTTPTVDATIAELE